jgi:phospholipase C
MVFAFGRPTPGIIRVFLSASTGPVFDPNFSPLNGLGGMSGGLPGSIMMSVPPVGPLPLDLSSITDLDFIADVGFPGGGPSLPPPLDPTLFDVELIDGTGTVRTTSRGMLVFQLPEPLGSPLGGMAVPTAFLPPKWTVRVTNPTRFPAALTVTVSFTGSRPIQTKEVALDFINDKLDLIINNVPEGPPLRLVFENRDHEVSVRLPNGLTTTVTQTRTHVRIDASIEWTSVFPELNDVDYSLGAKFLNEDLASSSLHVKATVHDGALAFRVRMGFRSGGTINLGLGIVSGFLAERFLSGISGDIAIRRLAIEVFLVLRPSGDRQATIQVIGRPDIGLQLGGPYSLANAVFHLFLEEALQRAAVRNFLGKMAFDLLGWLLGDRGLELLGGEETLALRYAADDPRQDLVVQDRPIQSIPRPKFEPGNLSKIDHIVVLMMENRSFDHMLGFLSLPPALGGVGRSDINGLNGDESNPLDLRGNRHSVFPLSRSPEHPAQELTRQTQFFYDPDHSFAGMKEQRGGSGTNLDKNEGFIFNFAKRLSNKYALDADEERVLKGEIMGYHPASHVGFFSELAEQFTVCDAWHSSLAGATWPNRFVTLTGGLMTGPDGYPDVNNPDVASFDPLEVDTIFDHLNRAGVDWRYYEHDFCMIRLFSRYTFDQERVRTIDDPMNGFFAAAASGNLPAVAFIDPDLVDVPPNANDDHPPADIRAGQELIRRIVKALMDSPAWRKTMLVITYDEGGGFFDHVHPEPQQLLDPDDPRPGGFVPLGLDLTESGRPLIDRYGFRVPAFVISPWVPAKSVSSTLFDHTAITKAIISRFLSDAPPDMGRRVDYANDLGSLLSLRQPRAAFELVTAPIAANPLPVFTVRGERREPDDFHELMRAARARFGRNRKFTPFSRT